MEQSFIRREKLSLELHFLPQRMRTKVTELAAQGYKIVGRSSKDPGDEAIMVFKDVYYSVDSAGNVERYTGTFLISTSIGNKAQICDKGVLIGMQG